MDSVSVSLAGKSPTMQIYENDYPSARGWGLSPALGWKPPGPARRIRMPSAELTPRLPLPAPRRASQPHPGARPTESWAALRGGSCFPGLYDLPFPAFALRVQPRPPCPRPTSFQPCHPLTTEALWPGSAFSTWNRGGSGHLINIEQALARVTGR